MKKRISFLIYPLLIMCILLVFANSCENDDNGNSTNGKTTAEFNNSINYGTMTDQDGNVYKTVTIGTKTWMAENLRTTKYKDGTFIPNITDNDEWSDLSTGAFCNYNNTSSNDTIATFGRLYNWYAINTGKLAPVGWHIPSDAEWIELITYLGSESVAGDKLKEIGTMHWSSPNEATNETGFTALPSGYRSGFGDFDCFGNSGCWWSATEYSATRAWFLSLINEYGGVYRNHSNKEVGFSVRCVKD